MTDNENFLEIVERLRAGDEIASSEFYARYGPLLEKVASGHLESVMRRRVGPDDVAHSVCRTFLRRVQGGNFELEARDSLWRLLCAITVAKARKKARFHLAEKRGIRSEQQPSDETVDRTALGMADRGPTPAESAEFVDTFEHFLDQLDEEERKIVWLKLEQRSQAEIAQECGCSERTVRRIVQRVESRVVESFEED